MAKKKIKPNPEADRIKDELTFYQKLASERQKKLHLQETLAERLQNTVCALPSTRVLPLATGKPCFDPEEAILLFSDCQIGQETTREESGGFGEFNIAIFKKELHYLAEKLVKIIKLHRKAHRISRLHIFMLGDLTENETHFKHQPYYVEVDVFHQWLVASQEISAFLLCLAPFFEEIEVHCVSGNHASATPGEKSFLINWDILTYKFIEAQIKNQANIKFNIALSWWLLVDVMGWGFLLTHGDDIRRWLNFPMYGLDRTDKRWTQLLERVGKRYTYFVCGHHHVPLMTDNSKGEMIVNGTFVGDSIYALKRLASSIRPTQYLLFCHKKVGLTARYPIRLDKIGL